MGGGAGLAVPHIVTAMSAIMTDFSSSYFALLYNCVIAAFLEPEFKSKQCF